MLYLIDSDRRPVSNRRPFLKLTSTDVIISNHGPILRYSQIGVLSKLAYLQTRLHDQRLPSKIIAMTGLFCVFFFICFLKLFFVLCVFKAFSHSLILFRVMVRIRVKVKLGLGSARVEVQCTCTLNLVLSLLHHCLKTMS